MIKKALRQRTRHRTYKTLEEFEQAFLPNFLKKRIEENIDREPENYGTGLIPDLLRNFRKQLRG